jgi:hypothetical protein
MAAEKLQEYINSVDELQKAYSEVRKLGEIIANVGRYLNNFPYKMNVSNVPVKFVLSEDVEYRMNGDSWPSAKKLAEILSDYINKRHQVQRLYASLSDAQRNTVKPPSDI